MPESEQTVLLETLIQGRRSIRTYQDRRIPELVLDSILNAARWAPSPHHSLPFRFALLTSASAREALSRAMAVQWRKDLTVDHVPEATIESEVSRSERRLMGAPAIVVGCAYLDPLDTYPDEARQQAEHTMAAHALGAAMQNMMLTAHAYELGSAWMCAPLFCPEAVRSALDLADAWIPHALLTLGYPVREAPPGARPPLDQIIIQR